MEQIPLMNYLHDTISQGEGEAEEFCVNKCTPSSVHSDSLCNCSHFASWKQLNANKQVQLCLVC